MRRQVARNAHAEASALTRKELLDAGVALLTSLPASATFGHLTANRVATAAGRTTGAFFHQWESTDAYLRDLASYVLRPEMSVNLKETTDTLLALIAEGSTFIEALTAAGRDVPHRTAQDPQTVVELLLWNRALHDLEFQGLVRTLYSHLDEGSADTYEGLMALLGREPRPPFTTQSIGAIITSVSQGLAMRASLTPGLYPDDTFGWMILTLIPLLTRPVGDPQDAAEFVDQLPLELDHENETTDEQKGP